MRLSKNVGHHEPVLLSGAPQGGPSCPAGNSPPRYPPNLRAIYVSESKNCVYLSIFSICPTFFFPKNTFSSSITRRSFETIPLLFSSRRFLGGCRLPESPEAAVIATVGANIPDITAQIKTGGLWPHKLRTEILRLMLYSFSQYLSAGSGNTRIIDHIMGDDYLPAKFLLLQTWYFARRRYSAAVSPSGPPSTMSTLFRFSHYS